MVTAISLSDIINMVQLVAEGLWVKTVVLLVKVISRALNMIQLAIVALGNGAPF